MRALLHIGLPKTGSTSIQISMNANRAPLESLGFHVPESFAVPGRARHLRIGGLYTNRRVSPSRMRLMRIDEGSDLQDFRSALLKDLGKECQEHAEQTFLFSDEQICTLNSTQFQVLISEFKEFFSEIDVLVYLRRQDQHASSLYQQIVMSGNTPPEVLSAKDFHDYENLLDTLEALVGREHVHPRIFQKDTLVDGSVVADFYDFLEIKDTSDLETIGEQNTSPSREGLFIQREVNSILAELPLDANTEVLSRQLSKKIRSSFPGPKFRPLRHQAIAFQTQFNAGNDRVKNKWFPSRPELFNSGFDEYPTSSPEVISDSLEFATRLAEITAQGIEAIKDTPPEPEQPRSAIQTWVDYFDCLCHETIAKFPFATSSFRERFEEAANRRRQNLKSRS